MVRSAAGMIDVEVAAGINVEVAAAAEIVADVGRQINVEGVAPETD